MMSFITFFRSISAIDDVDGKLSSVREELVALQQSFNKAVLEKEILEAEKLEVNDALAKV